METTVTQTPLEAFLALAEGTYAQLIGGEIVHTYGEPDSGMAPAPLFRHQVVLANLNDALRAFARAHDLGVVVFAPLDVHLTPSDVFQPDLVFVSAAHADRIGADGVHGAPDLVAEVLSRSTAYLDLTRKRDAYEAAGVAEYWIVDPERRVVEVLTNGPNGFVRHDRTDGHGLVRSAVLDGFSLDVARLFEGA